MASDLLTSLAGFLADLGHETALVLGDPSARDALLARAGLPPPPGNPASTQAAAGSLDQVRTKATNQQGTGSDPLVLLAELSDAMIVLVSLVQEAANVHNADDAWNLLATCLDVIALDRLRRRTPEALAVLQAFHLVSNDRLLFGELAQSKDEWGSFLLGHPADDAAKADNWSIILGAVLVFVGRTLPLLDSAGRAWRTDLLFGWDSEPNPAQPLITHALQRMATIRFTHRSGGVEENAGLSAVVVPPADGGWGMLFALDLGAGLTFPIGTHLEIVAQADSPDALEAFIGDPSFVTTGLGHTTAKLQLRRKQEAADELTVGADDGVHLEIGTFLTGFEFADPVRFRFAIGGGAIVIPQNSLGFIGSVLPSGGAKFTFDVDLTVDSNGKLSFAGGAGMTVTIPVNESISALKVRSVTIALAIEGGDKGPAATLAVVVAFALDFGKPFKVVVDGIGAKLAWTLPSSAGAAPGTPAVHGNLGPAGDVSLGFVPPKGIGISIDVGPIKGGGFFFFDPPHRTYAGVLEAALSICAKGIQIKAAGLLRETDDGFDFVLILSAQFDPAIEIFLGLTLNGVGGMLGINVAVDVDKLRAGLHDGAIGRLLFPDDPVANAPAIIATMVSVFPHRHGGFVAGPMLQLGWGRPKSFVTISAAIVIALPPPALLAIVGRLRIVTPDELLPMIDIKVDFLGVISFEEPSFSFDASLVQSRVAAFPITGDMAMRAGGPGFILAVGGVHPRFTPPANLPTLRRIAIDISPNPITKIRAEAYLAVTSNTFMVGLHAALDIDAGVTSVHGWLDFDALIRWEPRFYFSIHMDIGLELRVGGHSIAGVSVDLLLEGPGPWHAKGEASLHILFFTVHAGFECTWGEVGGAETPPEIDVSVRVAEGLSAPGAWAAVAPAGDSWITFRTTNRPDVGVHPYGQLSARQQAVPIGVPITRIGLSHVVGGTATVTLAPIAGAPPASAAMGQFAASQFIDLSDDEKLSRPSFESFQDGITFGSMTTVMSSEQVSTADYETVFIPDNRRRRGPFDLLLLAHSLEVGAIARSGLHFATLHDGADQRVTLADASFRVVAADTMTAVAGAPAPFASATAGYAAAGAAGGRLLVVSAHEVAG